MNKFFLEDLQNWLKLKKIPFKKDYEIKYYSWIKAGGIIKNFITPETLNQCIDLIKFLDEKKTEFYVIGNQSNIIIRDGYIFTPVINLNKLNNLSIKDNKDGLDVYCESGVSIPRFSKSIIKKGFSGTEGLLGIPGSIGGGICMNASSYGSELTNYLLKVLVINFKGNQFYLEKKDLDLEWRSSVIKKEKFIVIGCYFFLPKKNFVGIEKTNKSSLKITNHRRIFQENDLPNLGSIFASKNIYEDLSKISFFYLILYLFYKIFSLYFFNFNRKNLNNFRKYIIKIYLKTLKLDKYEKFTSSPKTLNCMVNKGSSSSSEAIEFLNNFKKKTHNRLNLENIILDKIQ